jgi:hypothetical protein
VLLHQHDRTRDAASCDLPLDEAVDGSKLLCPQLGAGRRAERRIARMRRRHKREKAQQSKQWLGNAGHPGVEVIALLHADPDDVLMNTD